MSQFELHPERPTAACVTCHGALALQRRWNRLRAGERSRERVERMVEEARWFAMALEKIEPCPSHGGVRRLAHELAQEIEVVELWRDTRLECA
jgi:hypothetical protein